MYICSFSCATDIDMSVVGAHVAHTTATLAMGGEYSQARLSALSSQRMLQRTRYTLLSSTVSLYHLKNTSVEHLYSLVLKVKL